MVDVGLAAQRRPQPYECKRRKAARPQGKKFRNIILFTTGFLSPTYKASFSYKGGIYPNVQEYMNERKTLLLDATKYDEELDGANYAKFVANDELATQLLNTGMSVLVDVYDVGKSAAVLSSMTEKQVRQLVHRPDCNRQGRSLVRVRHRLWREQQREEVQPLRRQKSLDEVRMM